METTSCYETRCRAEIARRKLAQRTCPICTSRNTLHPEDATFPDDSTFAIRVPCECESVFTVSGWGTNPKAPLHLLCDISSMKGWVVCIRCSLPYAPDEAEEPRCPGCHFPGMSPDDQISGAAGVSSYERCPRCGNELEIYAYQSSTELRDGMTGDYFRTTKDNLAYCTECSCFYYIQTREDDKFGPSTTLQHRLPLRKDLAFRLINIYDLKFRF